MAALALEPNNATVLLVEDDYNIRLLVATALRRAGYEVTTSINGLDALDRIDEAIPDLIISDIMMPEMNGHELLTALRGDPVTRGIPVIFLTAKGETDDIIAGFNLGADDYLPKPFRIPELQARVRAKIDRPPVPLDQIVRDRHTNLLSAKAFAAELEREVMRTRRGGGSGCIAYVEFVEFERIRDRLGSRAEQALERQIGELLQQDSRNLDSVGRDVDGRFALLLPETGAEGAEVRLRRLHRLVVGQTFQAGTERISLTPIAGFSVYDQTMTADDAREKALVALDQAGIHLDLEPVRWVPALGATRASTSGPSERVRGTRRRWIAEKLRLPLQIIAVHVLGIVVPFLIYTTLDSVGFNIVPATYLLVVGALLMTAYMIWVEGFLSLKVVHPPETDEPPPAITAIIAAYLPNEASTVLETVNAFLAMDYPGEYQIILAYNTPRNLPIESQLRKLARKNPRFVPLRVENSTSKAQNVNAALAEATGSIVGVFDADHQPAPDSFTRAWRWIASGYDIVQGHCQVRNGGETAVSRTIAVEFELIYGVSHPGRARFHDFGIFGGSNGYWRTELLRRTRMHGFMLTEDIDSSMRVVSAGYKICSDPGLISRELAPITVKALWNQRMRWAQGWFQVSKKHFMLAMKSGKLSLRQKGGLFYLLLWREAYPWISLQMWPIIAFYAWKFGGVSRIDWMIPIFVLTTIFTLSVGPSQVVFAYLCAAPEIRKHKSWFVLYLFWAPFYSEFRNLIGRVAQIKEVMGERAWKVTPRSTIDRPPSDDE